MNVIKTGKVDPGFWRGRRVLVTGHTGFKGSWAALWLQIMGARLYGFGLSPPSSPSLYDLISLDGVIHSRIGDLRDRAAVAAAVAEAQPEIVLHLAAQSLVRSR